MVTEVFLEYLQGFNFDESICYLMNIYNYLFCYFYYKYQRKDLNGKIAGVGHITFVLYCHILLLLKLLEVIFQKKLVHDFFSNFNDSICKLFLVLVMVLIYFVASKYYSRQKIDTLTLEYNNMNATKFKFIVLLVVFVFLPIALLMLLTNYQLGMFPFNN